MTDREIQIIEALLEYERKRLVGLEKVDADKILISKCNKNIKYYEKKLLKVI